MTDNDQKTPLGPIEDAAKTYAARQADLAAKIAEVEAEVSLIYARHADDIRAFAKAEGEAKLDLIEIIDRNRRLFEKPKSRSIYGVKVGLRKGQDALDLGDEDRLIDRIRDLLPDKAGQLIRENVSVVRAGLKSLDRDELQRLGVHYVAGADEPFAAVEKSDAAKAAAAILDSLKERR